MKPLRPLWPWALFLAPALALTAVVWVESAPLPGDVGMTRWVQDRTWYGDTAGVANYVAGALSWLALGGGATAVLLAGSRGPADRGRRAALLVLGLALLFRAVTPVMKESVRSPRPDPSFEISVTEMRDSYGFPSGHVYTAVLVYGAVAWSLGRTSGANWRLVWWTAAAAVVVAAGPARVYVGAHWPSDVVGGYLWGATFLILAIRAGQAVDRHRRYRPGTPRAGPGR